MKTLQLLLVFFICFSGAPLPSPQPAEHLNEESRNPVAVDVTYGSRSGCFGSGPCRIEESDGQAKRISEGTARGVIWIGPDGKLVLKIDKNSMTKSTREKHFGQDYFEVPLAYSLPAKVSQAIYPGYSAFTIGVGHYEFREDEQYYTIEF